MANLIEANRARAQLIAEELANALWRGGGYYGGLWRGYKQSEQLVGELVSERLLSYRRPANARAVLYLSDIHMSGTGDVEYGDERVVKTDVTERYKSEIEIGDGETFKDTISHTFSKTRTFADAFKEGLQTAMRGSLKVGGSIISSELSVEERLTEEFERRFSTSDTQSDTATRELSIVGPKKVVYTAERRLNKLERTVTARADYDYGIRLVDATQISAGAPAPSFWDSIASIFTGAKPVPTHARIDIGWESLEDLLSVMRGEAPADHALADLYREQPATDELLTMIRALPGEASWLCEYDDVIDEDIDIE